ncbi:MAG: hypothetical protein HUJ51_06820 [Eggerthellaceae bacterium]|nr:hypothetical protein [Eggerthellaceae bacterium]
MQKFSKSAQTSGKNFSQSAAKKHDRIAILLPFSLTAILSIVALEFEGTTVMPIDYSLPIEEIQRLATEVDVSAIFTDAELLSEFTPKLVANYPVFVNHNTCKYALSPDQLQASAHATSTTSIPILP